MVAFFDGSVEGVTVDMGDGQTGGSLNVGRARRTASRAAGRIFRPAREAIAA